MLSEVYWHPTSLYGDILRLPSHRAVQYLVDPAHEAGRWSALRLLVQPDDVIVDIGAEQGELSALLASWVPEGGIVLVEPNPRAWPTIAAIFDENALSPRLAGTYAGLLNSTGGDGSGWAESWPEVAAGNIDPAAGMANLAEQADDFPTITLDRLCASADVFPDVVNIDVEGAELEVLRGAEHVLTDLHPVIALSVHPELLKHWWATEVREVFDLLEGLGYRCQLVHADHELHYLCL